jgi:hypothetical protein
MSVITCVCGNLLPDIYECDTEGFTANQIKIFGCMDQEYYEPGEGRSILECERCGALAIEHPRITSSVKFYLPENGKFNNLFTR